MFVATHWGFLTWLCKSISNKMYCALPALLCIDFTGIWIPLKNDSWTAVGHLLDRMLSGCMDRSSGQDLVTWQTREKLAKENHRKLLPNQNRPPYQNFGVHKSSIIKTIISRTKSNKILVDLLVIGRMFKLHQGPWWVHLDKVDLAIFKFHWDSLQWVASVPPLSLRPLLAQHGGIHGCHPWWIETKSMILTEFRGCWQPTLQICKQMCCWSSISPFHHCIVGNSKSLRQHWWGMSLLM